MEKIYLTYKEFWYSKFGVSYWKFREVIWSTLCQISLPKKKIIMKLYQSHSWITLKKTLTSHASTHQESTFFLKPLMKL